MCPPSWISLPKSGKGTWRDISPKNTYRWVIGTRKDAQHHSLLDKCKSKLQEVTTLHQSVCPSSKSLQTMDSGDGMEWGEHSCNVNFLPISPFSLSQSPCLRSLSHTANSHWLSILHMVLWISMLLSPYISPSPSSLPILSIGLFSKCVSPLLHWK